MEANLRRGFNVLSLMPIHSTRRLMLRALALAASAGILFAQNITGTWQGTLTIPQAPKGLRIVVKISRADDESLKAALYSIDQAGGQAINANAASFQGGAFKMTIAGVGITYEGRLNPDGASMTGTFTQGGNSLALNLVKATPQTEWTIPEPPPPPRTMAKDVDPSFEVATIKPSRPEAQGFAIQVGRGGQNMFTTANATLSDLIVFAYGIHPKQLTGAPAWSESDKYDISAKPDQPGIPNVNQLRTMVQKLLADRFQLTFHRDKKELSAYALTVAKAGVKFAKSDATGNLPGLGGTGPGGIFVRNATMGDFAGFLQSRVLERPVVDQTSLDGRYDFQLKWTPDAAQLAQFGPNAPPPPSSPDAPPDLFAAVQQQLGLKLESTKAPVEVLVIDRVQKPSEN